MNKSDEKTYIIYPAYINSNRTVHRGRRLPKDVCVVDPRWQEIRDVLDVQKNLKVIAEPNKVYPREADKENPIARGRVKVTIISEDEQIRCKDDILKYCTTMIPKLKTRTKPTTAQTANTNETVNTVANKKKKGKR